MKIEKIGQYSSLPAIKKQRVNRNSKNGFWGNVNEIDYNFKNDCYFVYYYVNDSPRLQIKRKNYDEVAQELERKRIEYYRTGALLEKSTVTLGQICQEWLTDIKKVGEGLTTESHHNLEVLCHGIGAELLVKKIQNITTRHIKDFFLKKSELVSESTVKKYKQLFTNLFKYAETYEYINLNPISKMDLRSFKSSIKTKERNAMTSDDRKLFLEAIEGSQYKNIFLFLYRTGLRVGEAIAIEESKVNFEEGVITIDQQISYKKKFAVEDSKDPKFIKYLTDNVPDNKITGKLKLPKNKTSIRKIVLSDSTVSFLKDEIEIRDKRAEKNKILGKEWSENKGHNFIFVTKNGKYLTQSNISRSLKAICLQAGLSKIYSVHELRHTAITRMCEEGASIQDIATLVGHADMQMIIDIYNSLQWESSLEKKEELKKFF